MTVIAAQGSFTPTAIRTRGGVSRTGIFIVATFALIAVLAPVFVGEAAFEQQLSQRLLPPSPDHWLGTDGLGRDVLARALVATSVDLPIALAAVALAGITGCVLGVLAGLGNRLVETVIMRVSDIVLAFPTYILVIAMIAMLGPGVTSLLVSFALVGWVPYTRLLRERIKRVKGENYIAAAHLLELSAPRIAIRHVLPNSLQPVLSFAVIDLMLALITLASLSYLGIGVQPPFPEWGVMVAEGQPYIQTHWWLTAAPGAMIALLGTGFLLLGESLERRTW